MSADERFKYESIHGDLLSVEYSNDPLMTPAVAYTYDRAGRQSTVTQDATVVTFGYSTTGGLLTETYSGGPLNGLSITNGYDHRGIEPFVLPMY